MAAAARNNPEAVINRLLQQNNQHLMQENDDLRQRNAVILGDNARLQGLFDEAQANLLATRQENQGLREENQGLQNRIQVLEADRIERVAADAARDAQIAFLMARINAIPAPAAALAAVVPPARLPAPVQIQAQMNANALRPPQRRQAPEQEELLPAPDFVEVPALGHVPTELEQRVSAELAAMHDNEIQNEIRENPWKYRYLSAARRDDENTLLTALGHTGGRGRPDMFKFASQRLKDNCEEAAWACVRRGNSSMVFVSDARRDNAAFARFADTIGDLSDRLRGDKNIALHFVRKNPYDFRHVSVDLRNDMDVLLATFEATDYHTRQHLLDHASDRLKQDPQVHEAIRRRPGICSIT